MTDEFPEMLGLYLNGDIDINTLEDCILPLAWDTQSEEERDAVDLILAEICCVRDQTSDEDIFRQRVAKLIAHEPESVPDANAIPV